MTASSRGTSSPGPGLFSGIGSVFQAMGFVFVRPRLWPYAIVPVVVCGLLLGVFASGGVLGTTALTRGLVERDGGSAVLAWLLRVVLWLVSIAVAFLLATALAQPLSGFALDTLSQEQEHELGGPRREGPSFFEGLVASLKVTFLGLLVGLPALFALAAASFLFPPLAFVCVPLKVVVVGLLAAWDFLDYPLSLRKMKVRDRVAFMTDHFGAVLGLGVTVALLLLLPGIGLFLLPLGVVAGTRLVVLVERGAR